ncbi:MAG: hypothetical protein ACLP0J_26130 [Solirubrobacteraceae bacterium]
MKGRGTLSKLLPWRGLVARVIGLAVAAMVVTAVAGASSTACAPSTAGQHASGCVTVPWQLLGAGPGQRSVLIVLAPGCSASTPVASAAQSASAVRSW